MNRIPLLFAVVLLACWTVAAQAGPIGAIETTSPGDSEYRVEMGAGFFQHGRRLHTNVGDFEVTRSEAYGTLTYTGYDWSVGLRAGATPIKEKALDDGSGGATRDEKIKALYGLFGKFLIYADPSGDFGVGGTVQANRYMSENYQNYMDLGLAITAQQRWGKVATVYGGPYFSYGGGRRKSEALDNTGTLAPRVDYAKEAPVFGLCMGFNFRLPKAMVFEVEGQFTGLAARDGFSVKSSEWGVGASLRYPLWK
jgi:hypothetical protein